jgi:hypothetical protein
MEVAAAMALEALAAYEALVEVFDVEEFRA